MAMASTRCLPRRCDARQSSRSAKDVKGRERERDGRGWHTHSYRVFPTTQLQRAQACACCYNYIAVDEIDMDIMNGHTCTISISTAIDFVMIYHGYRDDMEYRMTRSSRCDIELELECVGWEHECHSHTHMHPHHVPLPRVPRSYTCMKTVTVADANQL